MSTETLAPHPAHTNNRFAKCLRLVEAAVDNYDILFDAGTSDQWSDDIWLCLNDKVLEEPQPLSRETVAMTVGILMGMGL